MIRNIILGVVIGALLTVGYYSFFASSPDQIEVYCDGYSQGAIDTTALIFGPPPMNYPGPTKLRENCSLNPPEPIDDLRDIMPLFYPPPS